MANKVKSEKFREWGRGSYEKDHRRGFQVKARRGLRWNKASHVRMWFAYM